MTAPRETRYGFAIDPRYGRLLRLFGVAAAQDAWVHLDDGGLTVRFGYWSMRTPVSNLAGAEVSGPFSTVKVLGPRLSLADRGITFGSNAERGTCIRFHRPVRGIEPLGLLRHPGVTVTVEDPDALAESVRRSITPGTS